MEKEPKNMVEMIQLKSREEWLKNRNRIGGSDASAIVGMNPYRSNVDLWKIKTGQLAAEDISEKQNSISGNCSNWISRNIRFFMWKTTCG